MNIADKFVHAGRTITIYYDEDPPDPRDNDNVSRMVCWHRRMNLGDKHNWSEQMTESEMREVVTESGNQVLAILPIYLIDHSGVSIQTTPFGDRWDSGQVGWAYITKARAHEMGFAKSDQPEEYWENVIRAEVTEYDQYLRGECYGYEITGIDGSHIDSCWGFVGDIKYVSDEARSEAEHTEDPDVLARASELSARATYAG